MSPINCHELHQLFKILDTNEDGLVSIEELKGLLEKTGVQISLDELKTIVGNTCLDLMDFWVFYDVFNKHNPIDGHHRSKEVEQEMMEGDILKAFKMFDMNDDGFISSEELQSTLSRLGLWNDDSGQRSCRSMIEFYDTNNDGVLDFEEFKNMLLLPKSFDSTGT
ncbi:unnamed protein product [Lactuca saligna]|uniref:EF-hand domain-containing protein n=1 Tax=Lactuca saligna TaxID=75948 RepID=A0AA35VCZ5_LACSI|nr:unnamed protein product [Lactuca saligna]